MRALRSLSLLAASSLLAAGCGLAADPVVQGEDEVLDALLALGDGAEARATASLEYDEAEVRDLLRRDDEARALLEERLDDTDVDGLLDELADVRDELADHALLLATGADGSARLAAAYRDRVWLDLRTGGTDGATTPTQVALQARVDWATVAELAEAPDLTEQLDAAVTELAPFLGELPETAAVQEVLLGLLAGELVAIDGELDEGLLDGLAGFGGLERSALEGLTGLADVAVDPRELLATALAFDGFRRDGTATVVDVHLELRAAATLLLDTLATATEGAGPAADELADARAEVAALPVRLDDVATVRLDEDGTVQQVRADVLGVLVQLAAAVAPDDPDVATVVRVTDQLEATGLVVVLDVTGVGTTATVLSDPTATATPAEVTAALSRLLFRGLGGGLDPAALAGLLGGLDQP